MMRLTNFRKQSGHVLLVALGLTMIVTLWGVSSTRNTALSQQINYNAKMKQLSFQAAEFAIRQVEQLLLAEITLPEHIPAQFNGTNGRYSLVMDRDPFMNFAMPPEDFDFRVASDWLSTSHSTSTYFRPLSFIEVEYDDDSDSVNYMERQPRAIVEFMGRDALDTQGGPGWAVFRISAIGWGPEGKASSVIRTHFRLSVY
jgi:Tfp pilus assembly protein PilX